MGENSVVLASNQHLLPRKQAIPSNVKASFPLIFWFSLLSKISRHLPQNRHSLYLHPLFCLILNPFLVSIHPLIFSGLFPLFIHCLCYGYTILPHTGSDFLTNDISKRTELSVSEANLIQFQNIWIFQLRDRSHSWSGTSFYQIISTKKNSF